MTRQERDWLIRLADWIDCEGHIGIWVYPQYEPPRWFAGIGITNTNMEMLKIFQSKYGGHLNVHSGTELTVKDRWDLHWRGARSTRKLALQVIPFLMSKKERCRIFLEALKDPVFNMQGKKADSEIWARRQILANSVNNSPESIPSEAL